MVTTVAYPDGDFFGFRFSQRFFIAIATRETYILSPAPFVPSQSPDLQI